MLRATEVTTGIECANSFNIHSGATHSALTHPMQRFKVTALTRGRLWLPAFSGSMIRGALGHALKQLYCFCPDANCHQDQCLYASLFETGAGAAFVITPPRAAQLASGASFCFDLTIMDASERHTTALRTALTLGLRRGLGQHRVSCQLQGFAPLTMVTRPLGQRVMLTLTTPWFLKRQGNPILASDCTPHSLLIGIAQRQRQLQKMGFLNTNIPANSQLLQIADRLVYQSDFMDVHGERRSNRQMLKHPLQGITGNILLQHEDADGLLPLQELLHIAQWVHGGGKTSFGLGGLLLGSDVAPSGGHIQQESHQDSIQGIREASV